MPLGSWGSSCYSVPLPTHARKESPASHGVNSTFGLGGSREVELLLTSASLLMLSSLQPGNQSGAGSFPFSPQDTDVFTGTTCQQHTAFLLSGDPAAFRRGSPFLVSLSLEMSSTSSCSVVQRMGWPGSSGKGHQELGTFSLMS